MIVHPKIKILSFTHPQVVPNLYECLCSAEHKGRYSEEWGKQQFWGTIDFHSIFFFSYYGSQWCPKTAWLQTFFQISSFVFGWTKKFIQVWNYLRVSKWWQNFHFWVNYPFKLTKWKWRTVLSGKMSYVIVLFLFFSDLFHAHLFWGLNSKVTFAIIKVWRSHGWSVWLVCKIFVTQYLLKSHNPRIVLPRRRLCMDVFLVAIVTCFLMLPFSLYRFISKPKSMEVWFDVSFVRTSRLKMEMVQEKVQ